MIRKNELVYICSPLSAPTQKEILSNMAKAMEYAKLVSESFQCRAIAPHSFLPLFLDDNIPEERAIGLQFGLSVLEICKAMVVCGDRISNGMKGEIEKAKKLHIPVYTLIERDNGVGIVLRIEEGEIPSTIQNARIEADEYGKREKLE